jgi:DNA polymerase elongation subunit (family B)
MIPAQFYFARSVPKPFTMVINSATGSPINAILIRSYLQHGHSIPRETEKTQFEGAISEGNPGIYKYVKKLDVSSLYPSIILQYEIWDRKKDPKGYFYKMVEYFTTQRLADKAKYQETGDVYYRDLSESRKITINSAYGVMGAPGLQFNSPDNAALITRKGREILTKGIEWVKTKGYTLVNVDTDSFSYTKNVPMSEEEQRIELNEVNNLFPERIRWADDGYYKSVLVLKAKNYVLWDGKKKKIKGSALRSATREKALAEFIDKFSDLLLEERFNDLIDLYNEYVEEIKNIKDINRWAAKKTITEKVINPQRTNEAKVLEALGDSEFSAGDKRYFYFKTDKSLGLVENWKNDHDIPTFLKKLHNTVKIFESVVDLSLFPNYSLKKNLKLLYPKGVNNE